jgi:hypothetical protein
MCGKHDVWNLRPHAGVVPFHQRAAALHDHETVGPGGRQQAAHRPFAPVRPFEGQAVEQRGDEVHALHQLVAAMDRGGRNQLPHMVEAPAVERRQPPIGERHLSLVRRREAFHDLGLAQARFLGDDLFEIQHSDLSEAHYKGLQPAPLEDRTVQRGFRSAASTLNCLGFS